MSICTVHANFTIWRRNYTQLQYSMKGITPDYSMKGIYYTLQMLWKACGVHVCKYVNIFPLSFTRNTLCMHLYCCITQEENGLMITQPLFVDALRIYQIYQLFPSRRGVNDTAELFAYANIFRKSNHIQKYFSVWLTCPDGLT